MDKENINSMLIPGELSAPNKRRGLGEFNRKKEAALYDSDCAYDLLGGVEQTPGKTIPQQSGTEQTTAPHSAIVAGSSESAAKNTPKPAQGDDYTKTYQRRMTEQQRMSQSSAGATEARAQTQKETGLRNEARDLQDQLRYWKAQEGQGSHDSATVSGNISSIENRLHGIDGKYWS